MIITEDRVYIDFTPESRLNLINLAIEKVQAKSYLEIGCDEDFIFSKINTPIKVGVDWKKGGTVRMSSDEFFKTNTQKFDVIFIDGNHDYEFVKRDVYNSLNCLNKNGIIIMHDMLPQFEISTQDRYMGTVWRSSFDLIAEPNLIFKIVKIDCGCGVILPGKQKIKQFELKGDDLNTWNDYTKHFDKLPLVSYEEIKTILNDLEW